MYFSNSFPICYLIGFDRFSLTKKRPFYGGYTKGVHLFPYRTEKLSPLRPMVLHHNAGE